MFLRVLMVALTIASTAVAQEPNVADGQILYREHCVQCHGADNKGDGPMAEMLAIDTPDLSGLAARNDGVFPTQAVAERIDGRASMLAHGGDMPIFGAFLDSDQSVVLRLPSGQPMITGLPLANVVVYLQSIQE